MTTMQRDAAEALFTREGTRHEVGSDRPFLLDDDGVWMVSSGRLDVFAVRVADGAAHGSRRHLFRAEAGTPILAVGLVDPVEGVGLLAVGGSGTTLMRLPAGRVRGMARDPEHAAGVARVVDAWIHTLWAAVTPEMAPSDCDEMGDAAEVDLRAGVRVRTREGVRWVTHTAGHSFILGRPDARANGDGCIPVSPRVWLSAERPVRLRLQATEGVLATDELWAGVGRLHRMVLRLAHAATVEAEEREHDHLRRRGAAGRTVLRSACARLASTLHGGANIAAPMRRRGSTGNEDALFAACRLVGNTMRIPVRPRPRREPGENDRTAPLEAVARASKFRTRTVMLRGRWWREDNGPLLGYLAEGKLPVALLPVRGGYEMHDPTGRRMLPVGDEVALTLEPFAHTFYRPFPEHELGLRDVVRFGALGCGRDLGSVALLGAAAGALGMIPPMAIGMMFNSIIPGADRGHLLQLVVVLVAVAAATTLFGLTRSVAMLRVQGRVGAAVQAATWDRLLALPMGFFRPYTAGNLAVRAMGIDGIRQIVFGAASTSILAGIFSVFNFGLLFYYSPVLARWAGLLIVLALAATLLTSYLQMHAQRVSSSLRARISGQVLQFLTSIGKLRVAGAEVHAFGHWAHLFGAQRAMQYRVRAIGNWYAVFGAILPVASWMVIFSMALPLMQDPESGLRVGDFLAFLAAFGTCLSTTIATGTALVGVLAAVPLYEAAQPIFRTRPEVDEAKADPGPLSGQIRLQHVTFRYNPDGPATVRDVSLEIRAGEFVAFVGPSGSGKSTLLRLLLGFETPESGSIVYDDHELTGLDVQAVRRQMGVVLQTGRVVPGDIFTNVVGSSMATMEDACEAARMAGLADDIKAMPMGMHTVVSEGGGTLSGGQRQRMMIARAIVGKPRILFFDEATSALDNRTQNVVSESLDRLQATRLVIAHRLSTVVNADRICVLHDGRIAEEGTYSELMEREGLFYGMAQRQIA